MKGRRLSPDEDAIPVVLRQGRNRLLLKIENRGRSWGFLCRLVPIGGQEDVSGLIQLLDLDFTAPQPVLRLRFPSLFTEGFLDSVDVAVCKSGDPDLVLWSDTITSDVALNVPVAAGTFTKYVLRMDATLSDGTRYADDIPFSQGEPQSYTLFRDAASDYEIVLGDNASESERWAAYELSHWLTQIGGASLHVRTTRQRKLFPRSIILGYHEMSADLLPQDCDPPADDDESFRYFNAGPDVVIVGGRDRGTMYGVFTFLEREFGCRWYTPQAAAIPTRDEYTFEYLCHSEKPGLRMREVCYFDALDPVWRARNKVNTGGSAPQMGGQYHYWNVHTFAKLMPPGEFFDSHPEYYSLNDGVRVADKAHPHNGAQLCLTNPNVLRIMTERIKQAMREHPECLVYSISQNDGVEFGPCECDACRAVKEQYGGTESAVIIWFVNRVADAVRDEFPDKFIGTLAYTYSEEVPTGIRPRDNVVVRLCNFYGDMAHPLDSPNNAHPAFADAVRGWRQIAPHLYIWDYVISFGHYALPFPNLRAMPEHIRFYHDNNAFGYYPQALSRGRGGEFTGLRAYLLAKLMWNPDTDAGDVIDDFVYGYYGRGGRFVRKYIDLLHDLVTPETHIGLSLGPHDPLFSDAFVEQAEALLDEAERVADSPEIRRRVEMARLPIMYLKCHRTPAIAKGDGTYDRVKAIFARECVRYLSDDSEYGVEQFHGMMNGVE